MKCSTVQYSTVQYRSFQPSSRAVHDSTVHDSTVHDRTVQYSTDREEIQPAGNINSENIFGENIPDVVDKAKMDKLKAQQVRLCSMSKDFSKQLAKIDENKEKIYNDANVNFLKVLNEKVNQNDAKMLQLLRRIETLKRDNKTLKEKLYKAQIQTIPHPPTIPQPPIWPLNQEEPPKTVDQKKRRPIPTCHISSGEGERDETNQPPPMTWAYVASRGFKKKKKEQIPDEVLECYPEIVPKDVENPDHIVKYTEEENNIILDELERSAKKIGFKPIPQIEINKEAQRLQDKGMPGYSKRDLVVIAIKNCVTQFMKNNLKIDEATRNSINIKKIIPKLKR